MIKYLLVLFMSLFISVESMAQTSGDAADPRQMALDIYSGINRGMEPATIALKLTQVVRLFRYQCARVSDYQVFATRPNITDIKVKCSGSPLYGVTVASNGFLSVYGGNSILAQMDRRDGLILSFDAEGAVEDTSAFDADRVLEETRSRVMLGDEYNYIYLSVMLLLLVGLVGLLLAVFIRISRKKRRHKPRGRMKPMKRFKVGLSSEIKDRLIADSTEIAKFVYAHDSGVFLAIGKRGKRRMYLSPFWAKLYARWNININEATDDQLEHIDFNLPDMVDLVEEGEEVPMPK